MRARPTTRTPLAVTLETQAAWRRGQAEEDPEDERNGVWAERLAALSGQVRELPADHPSLRKIDQIIGRYDGILKADAGTRDLLSRPESSDVETWLGWLLDSYMDHEIAEIADSDPSTLLEIAEGEDPEVRLVALRQLSYYVDASIEDAVREAREAGLSWADIAGRLGKGTQTVWKKYSPAES